MIGFILIFLILKKKKNNNKNIDFENFYDAKFDDFKNKYEKYYKEIDKKKFKKKRFIQELNFLQIMMDLTLITE